MSLLRRRGGYAEVFANLLRKPASHFGMARHGRNSVCERIKENAVIASFAHKDTPVLAQMFDEVEALHYAKEANIDSRIMRP